MRYYIVSWDMNGVEFFEEITEHHPDNWAKSHLFDTIKQSKRIEKPMSFNVQALKLRVTMKSTCSPAMKISPKKISRLGSLNIHNRLLIGCARITATRSGTSGLESQQ